MRAEKTPRNPEKGKYDYSIPTGRKDLKDWDRWNYPEVDFGLMGQFKTQKETYKHFIDTLEDYQSQVKNYKQATKDKASAADESGMIGSARGDYSARSSARGSAREGYDGYDSARSSARGSARGDYSSREPDLTPTTLDEHKISTFKGLGGPNPEVLAQWRATRAAEFIQHKGNFEPKPKQDVDHGREFMPPGKFHDEVPDYGGNKLKPPKKHKKVWGGLVPHSTGGPDMQQLQDSLKNLTQELQKTESAIKKQESSIQKHSNHQSSIYSARNSAR